MDSYEFAYDQVAAIPIALSDGIIIIPGAVPNAAVVCDTPALIAASISADGESIVLVPQGPEAGTCNITLSSGTLTAWKLAVTLTVPVASAVVGNVAAAVTTPLVPTGATAAPV